MSHSAAVRVEIDVLASVPDIPCHLIVRGRGRLIGPEVCGSSYRSIRFSAPFAKVYRKGTSVKGRMRETERLRPKMFGQGVTTFQPLGFRSV